MQNQDLVETSLYRDVSTFKKMTKIKKCGSISIFFLI